MKKAAWLLGQMDILEKGSGKLGSEEADKTKYNHWQVS